MAEFDFDLDLQPTLTSIEALNKDVKSMFLRWSVLRGSPPPSVTGPVQSPSKPFFEPNSPVSLNAFKAYYAAKRTAVFTPPSSPMRKEVTRPSPYSPIGPAS
ncbi:MAG: hypothetical protein K0U37_00445 [Gammaproteobacteria bacterium]|nr:hypothetical protein [Gammaproteobacteria bacterium]